MALRVENIKPRMTIPGKIKRPGNDASLTWDSSAPLTWDDAVFTWDDIGTQSSQPPRVEVETIKPTMKTGIIK